MTLKLSFLLAVALSGGRTKLVKHSTLLTHTRQATSFAFDHIWSVALRRLFMSKVKPHVWCSCNTAHTCALYWFQQVLLPVNWWDTLTENQTFKMWMIHQKERTTFGSFAGIDLEPWLRLVILGFPYRKQTKNVKFPVFIGVIAHSPPASLRIWSNHWICSPIFLLS